jgi:hypothetical protein
MRIGLAAIGAVVGIVGTAASVRAAHRGETGGGGWNGACLL